MTDKKGDMPDYSRHLQFTAWIKKDKNNKTFLTFKLCSKAIINNCSEQYDWL